MFFIIYILIPLTQTLAEYDNSEEPDYSLMPYDDNPFDDTPLFVAEVAIQKYPCQDDEYTIVVQMSSKRFSGTDDKVEIRLYDSCNKRTEWLQIVIYDNMT